jgi:hypothetical protein
MLANCLPLCILPYSRIESKCRHVWSLQPHPPQSRLTPYSTLSLGYDLRQGNVADFDILVRPLVEQLDAANLAGDVLGQNLVARDGLNFDISVVRHDCDFWAGW